MRNVYVVTGRLTNDRTVTLDEPLPIGKGKLRVTLEPIEAKQKRDYLDVMGEIREGQEARGHKPPTAEEVLEYIRTERASWDR